MTETAVEHLELMTRDRVTLQADLAVPDAAHAAAIICHPHPRYGGEQLDAIAALNALEVRLPGLAIIATGYSFGAAIVSALDDVRITTKVLVAPPLASMPTVRGMEVPTLVLTPAHDQFSAPDATEAIISEWPQTTHETVASADHFLNGRTGLVAERAVAFITRTPCA